MKHLLIIVLLIVSCTNKASKSISVTVKAFEDELSLLDKSALASIDKATDLFGKYAKAADNKQKIDSLFQPYFVSYSNIGTLLLKTAPDSLISKYGFVKTERGGKIAIVPSYHPYLQENVLRYLSPTMQDFTEQQLKEFTSNKTLAQIGTNTIWWEQFNTNNPDFFLKEMTTYHYKYWHLKNLMNGTTSVKVYMEEDVILAEALMAYKKIIADYPETSTAQVLVSYLKLLNESKGVKTDKVKDYLAQLAQ